MQSKHVLPLQHHSVEEIHQYLQARIDNEEEPVGMVIFDDELSAKQLRNIEQELQFVEIFVRLLLVLLRGDETHQHR